MSRALLSVEGLRVDVAFRTGPFRRSVRPAVNGVSFEIAPGECLALVGESGCGKSTLARALLRLIEPTSGRVRIGGEEITALDRRRLRRARRRVQMIFQDPLASLPSRRRIGSILREPLDVHRIGPASSRDEQVRDLLQRVGMPIDVVGRFPHQLSGGQLQRIAIARALAVEPVLLVADEPVSALDMTLQARILQLLSGLQRSLGLGLLFISHDLGAVRQLADRVAVMYLGELVELAPTADLFRAPGHPYTQALLAAAPGLDPDAEAFPGDGEARLAGEVPSLLHRPTGCPFHPRCPLADSRCRSEPPAMRASAGVNGVHRVACHRSSPGAEGCEC